MSPREIRIYDEPWPTADEIMFRLSERRAPDENWKEKLLPGEVALFFKDIQTGLPRSVEGRIITRDQQRCFAFSSLDEGANFAREVVSKHAGIAAEIVDRNGKRLKTIVNRKANAWLAVASWAPIAVCLAVIAFLVAGISRLFHRILPTISSGLAVVTAIGVSAFLVAILARVAIERPLRKSRERMQELLSKDREKWGEIGRLAESEKLEDRQRAARLYREQLQGGTRGSPEAPDSQ